MAYGNDIGFGATLEDALNQVLKGGGVTTPNGPPLQSSEDVQAAIDAANKAYSDAQNALAKSDWTAYGEAQKQLKSALDQLTKLRNQGKSAPATPTPVPSGSPTPPVDPGTYTDSETQWLAVPICIAGAGAHRVRAHRNAGWSSSVARWAHNPEVVGSNPTPATKARPGGSSSGPFACLSVVFLPCRRRRRPWRPGCATFPMRRGVRGR